MKTLLILALLAMSPRALTVANWLTSQPVEKCFPGIVNEWVGPKHVQLAVRGSITTPSEAIADMKPFPLDGFSAIEPYYEHENMLQTAFDSAHAIIAFRHGAEEELELALIGGANAPAFAVASRDLSTATLGGLHIGSPRTDVERRYGVAKRSSRACGLTLVEYVSKSGTYFFDVVYAPNNTVRALVYANAV